MDTLATPPVSDSATGADLAQVLKPLLDLAVRAAGAAGGAIWLDPLGASPELLSVLGPEAAGWGAPPAGVRRALESQSGLAADAALGRVAAVRLEGEAGRGAAVAVWGVPPQAAEAELLESLRRLLARLADRGRPPGGSQMRRRRQDLLQQIAAALTSALQFDEILALTVGGIRGLLEAEAASLLLLDEQRGDLVFKKSLGDNPDWIFQYGPFTGQGIVGECVRTGRPVVVENVADHAQYLASLDGILGYETRSVLCVPLRARGQILGALEVINKRRGAFSSRDQELLTGLAASVAGAVYNARLFHELTLANAELEATRWEVTRSRNTLQVVFDSVTNPIYIVDRQYHLTALNQAGVRLAGGGQQAAFAGRLCYQALYRRAEPCAGCRVVQAFVEGQAAEWAERRWTESDQATEWEVSAYPIRDEVGRPIQAVVFRHDVTDRRRLEASLAQSEKLAAVGELAAGVAHEINNPLAAIIANAQMLQRELAPDDERQESVNLIALASDRAARVIRSLLDFARQERVDYQPTDVNDTVHKAVALVDHMLRQSNVTLSTDLADDLPLLSGSPDHLQGVWLNLLLNARDALGGQPGEVQLTSGRHGQEVRVSVADTGSGIHPDKLPRIFDPFFTTKEPGRGTGLGLATCQRIVKQHGGHIRVESRVGRGTVFTVALPVETPAPT